MTTRQLQLQAYEEWNSSPGSRSEYHIFEYYWLERYARIYKLPSRIKSGRYIH